MEPAKPTAAERPLLTWMLKTVRGIGLLVKAILFCLVFFGVGASVAPLIFIGLVLGMFPNILQAAYSWLVTIPLLILLPFHAAYAFAMVLSGRAPDYTKGIYGAIDWVERNRLYDPTFKKPMKPKTDEKL